MAHEYQWLLVVRTRAPLTETERRLIAEGALDPLMEGLRESKPLVVSAGYTLLDERSVPSN